MIRSFRDRQSERVFMRLGSPRLPPEVGRAALRRLMYLNAAASLRDLQAPPGNRLEALSGDRAGQHSIRINSQWRICFRWHEGEAFDVEITDYH